MATNGNRGRFSDRIKKNAAYRNRRKFNIPIEDSKTIYDNFRKIIAVIPLVVIGNIIDKPQQDSKKVTNKTDNTLDVKSSSKQRNSLIVDNREEHLQKKSEDRKKIEEIDVSLIKKKQKEFDNNSIDKGNDAIKETKLQTVNDKSNIQIVGKADSLNKSLGLEQEQISQDKTLNKSNTKSPKELEKKIIDLLKTDLVRMLNELEIYESELYILSEVNNDERTLDACRENLAQVRKTLERVEELKERYDYLRDNFDFEYLLETNNNELIDRVIELRNMFGNNEVRATVEDYKLLEVYKQLYLKVDEMHTKTYEIEEQKRLHEEKLKQRDIDFEKLKDKVYNVNRANESYEYFVKQQNQLLADLSDKISKIDSHESVTYRMKGYGRYLFNTFKYMGLLLANPLKGLIPSIATQTIVARNAVNNLRRGLEWEEQRKMVYEAVDYSSTINIAIHDLDMTDKMVDASLDDLVRLKMEYNDKFRKYQGDFYEYRDVIARINKMQDLMIGNKIKIEMMKTRMLENERANSNKMKLVRKLNDDQNKKAA